MVCLFYQLCRAYFWISVIWVVEEYRKKQYVNVWSLDLILALILFMNYPPPASIPLPNLPIWGWDFSVSFLKSHLQENTVPSHKGKTFPWRLQHSFYCQICLKGRMVAQVLLIYNFCTRELLLLQPPSTHCAPCFFLQICCSLPYYLLPFSQYFSVGYPCCPQAPGQTAWLQLAQREACLLERGQVSDSMGMSQVMLLDQKIRNWSVFHLVV